MRIRLVFDAWLDKVGKPIEADCMGILCFNADGLALMANDFHAGSTFPARIELDRDAADDLRAALAEGYKPVFYAVAIDPDSWRAAANEAQLSEAGLDVTL